METPADWTRCGGRLPGHLGRFAVLDGGTARPLRMCLAPSYTCGVDTSRMAKALGRRGGLARARRLSKARRAEIASLGGEARARSLEAARRIAENFRYAAAVRELGGGAPIVERESTFSGRLPGIYPPSRSAAAPDDGLPRRRR